MMVLKLTSGHMTTVHKAIDRLVRLGLEWRIKVTGYMVLRVIPMDSMELLCEKVS